MATTPDPIFGVAVPAAVEGVPSEILQPRKTWSDGDAYDARAAKLAEMFIDNFKQFEADVSDEVKAAAPQVGVTV